MTDILLGGPDPFPEESASTCPEQHGGYSCTRDAGHPLPHVAMARRGGLRFVAASWPPFREASVDDVVANAGSPHRPMQQIADDLKTAIRLAQTRRQAELEKLMAPYFLNADWCCLFAFTGGLLQRMQNCLTTLVPGVHRFAVSASPAASEADRAWGEMVAAHMQGDTRACLVLFRRAIEDERVGELVAAAVVSTADVDRRAKASAN